MVTVNSFDYAAFIGELKALVGQAKSFNAEDRHFASAVFRKWKHELEDLIDRINRKRYSVNCDIHGRIFQVAAYGSISSQAQLVKFNCDLDDTVNELLHIIAMYEKYGDPKESERAASVRSPAAQTQSPQAELKAPDKVTLLWIFQNVPVSILWGAVVAVALTLAAAFTLGMAFTGTKAGRAILELVTPAEPLPVVLPSSLTK